MLIGGPVMWVLASLISLTRVIVLELSFILTSFQGDTLSLSQTSVASFLLRQCWHEKVPAGVVMDSVPRFSASFRKSALDSLDCKPLMDIMVLISIGGCPGSCTIICSTRTSSAFRVINSFIYIGPCILGSCTLYSTQ